MFKLYAGVIFVFANVHVGYNVNLVAQVIISLYFLFLVTLYEY